MKNMTTVFLLAMVPEILGWAHQTLTLVVTGKTARAFGK